MAISKQGIIRHTKNEIHLQIQEIQILKSLTVVFPSIKIFWEHQKVVWC